MGRTDNPNLNLPDKKSTPNDIDFVCVGCDGTRIGELGICSEAAISRVARPASPRERGDDAGPVDAPNTVVQPVSHVDIAVRINGDSIRLVELGICSRTPVSRVARPAGPRNGCDDARGVDAPDAMVPNVSDVDVVSCIGRDVKSPVEACICSRAAVSRVAPLASPRERGDDARRVDAPDDIIPVIYVDVAGCVGCDASRIAELGFSGGAAVSGVAPLTSPRERGDDARRVDAPNPVIPAFNDVDVVGRVYCDASRIVEMGFSGGAAVSGVALPDAEPGEGGYDARWVDTKDLIKPEGGHIDVASRVSCNAI